MYLSMKKENSNILFLIQIVIEGRENEYGRAVVSAKENQMNLQDSSLTETRIEGLLPLPPTF